MWQVLIKALETKPFLTSSAETYSSAVPINAVVATAVMAMAAVVAVLILVPDAIVPPTAGTASMTEEAKRMPCNAVGSMIVST